ncbi:hypothetical protein BGZ49_001679 [Haplosporangium sp. Z 27]|nr:hypothetical protein BGZ49_001679 [Haplosporangium sp. Z 27]
MHRPHPLFEKHQIQDQEQKQEPLSPTLSIDYNNNIQHNNGGSPSLLNYPLGSIAAVSMDSDLSLHTCYHNDDNVCNVVVVEHATCANILGVSVESNNTIVDGKHVVCSTSLDRVRVNSRVTPIQSIDIHSKGGNVIAETNALSYDNHYTMEPEQDEKHMVLKNKQIQMHSNDDNKFNSSQQLEHPHITYPNILQPDNEVIPDSVMGPILPTTFDTNNTDISPTEQVDASDAAKTSFPQITPNSSEIYSPQKKSPYLGWDLQNDQIRPQYDSSSDQDSDEIGRGGSDEIESSDSETERGWMIESNRPFSMKRRMLSEDEEEKEENEARFNQEIKSKISFAEVSNLRRSLVESKEQMPSTPSSPTSFSNQQQQQRPSTWPARKRRSVLADQQMDPVNNNIDTSSLSLLSATSELVSTGAIPDLTNKDRDSLPLLLTPSHSRSPSPPQSALIPTNTLEPFALDPFTFNSNSDYNTDDLYTPTPLSRKKHAHGSSFQKRHYRNCPMLLEACRKRSFEDAIEFGRPLGKDPSMELHRGCWFGSIKRRKIHHFPTLWTSTLSPSPYVKLMAMRDFWDIMKVRLDLSWLDLWTVTTSKWQGFEKIIVEEEAETENEMEEHNDKQVVRSTIKAAEAMNATDKEPRMELDCEAQLSERDDGAELPLSRLRAHRRRTLVQHPSTSLFLRGLWEEEEKSRRHRQMIPECVHRPVRSKILNRKPIPRMNFIKSQKAATSWIFPNVSDDAAMSLSSSSSSLSYASDSSDQTMVDSDDDEDGFTKTTADSNKEMSKMEMQQQTQPDQEMVVGKRQGPSPVIRSNAHADGYDMSDYKHWKDGTISPHQGYIKALSQMRNNMMDPWPTEESKAKDECTRMLHRMREQLNVVINLQIYLRTVMKTMPSQAAFMLSIRHPGQVSVEILNELYGPQFSQTSAFRTIERLLWDKTPSRRIENHHHHHEHHSNQPSRSYSYTNPQASEYQFQDRECEYDVEPDSFNNEYDQHQHHEYHYNQQHYYDQHQQQQQYHHAANCHIIEDDNNYRFQEEFDHQSRDPMLGMDAMVGVSDCKRDNDSVGGTNMDEINSEEFAMTTSQRRDDMLVDPERDLAY